MLTFLTAWFLFLITFLKFRAFRLAYFLLSTVRNHVFYKDCSLTGGPEAPIGPIAPVGPVSPLGPLGPRSPLAPG